jgi:hypothetical protein
LLSRGEIDIIFCFWRFCHMYGVSCCLDMNHQ